MSIYQNRIFSADDRIDTQTLTKGNLLNAVQNTDYLTFYGHGSLRYLRLSRNVTLTAEDIPRLPPVVISTGACQTFRIWGKGSIALCFTDQGAAAYIGFVHSPNGYLFGEPDGFSFRFTWPDFPIGHVVQIQNRGLLQGFSHFPFYFLLGDPRLSFHDKAHYERTDDREEGNMRILTYTRAPKGIIPVHVPGGARYGFVEIPEVGSARDHDPFYNGKLQMINIGEDKFLLFVHEGGDFTLRLHPEAPLLRKMGGPLIDALDHTTLLYHVEGSTIITLIVAGVLLVLVVRMHIRRRISIRSCGTAVLVGLCLTAFRSIFVYARQDHLAPLYANSLRTIDIGFEINLYFLFFTFIMIIFLILGKIFKMPLWIHLSREWISSG